MDHREARREVLSPLPAAAPGAPDTASAGRLAERVAAGGLVLATAVGVAAILLPERLPFQDLPAHAAFTKALPAAVAGTDPFYVASWYPAHGWLYEVVTWLLSLLVGADDATRLVLAASLSAVPAATWHLLRTLRLPGIGAAFVAPLFFTVPVVVGYVPYLASIPLALVTLAAHLRLAEGALTGRAWVRVTALFLATYGAHAFGYMAAALGGAAAVLVTAPRPLRPRRLAALLAAAVPAGLLVLGATLLTGGRDPAFAPGPGVAGRLATFVDRLSDVLISTVDTAVVGTSLLLLLVAAAASRGGRPDRRWLGVAAAAATCAAVWLALPEHVANPPIYQLADRFAVALAPMLPAAAGLSLRGVWRWLLVAPVGLALLLDGTILMMTLDYGRSAGAIDRLLARVPDGQTLISSVESSSDVRSGFSHVLVIHRPFLYDVEGRGRVIGNFGHGRMPIHYREAIAATFVHAHPEILISGNAHHADWVISNALPQSLPDDFAGPGFRLVLVDREPDLRLFRIERTP